MNGHKEAKFHPGCGTGAGLIRWVGLTLALGVPFLPPACIACRYTVRDVGFVESHASSYRLIPPPQALPGLKLQAEVSVVDSPIQVTEDGPATETHEPTGFILKSPGGEELVFPTAEDSEQPADSTRRFPDSIVQSPMRERLVDLVLDHFAVVALVESDDPILNQKATAEINAAIAQVADTMGSMPKAVGDAPVLLLIPSREFNAERVLAWALGAGDSPPRTPVAAVVYGRARRLGEPLVGTEITQAHVERLLSLVGSDCECGLDRRSLEGTLLPVRWDDSAKKRAAKKLGFDPDNPLVRLEINQILTRGPSSGKREETRDDPLLGYSEQVFLSDPPEPPRPMQGESVLESESVTPPVAGKVGLNGPKSGRWSVNWTLAVIPVLILGGGWMVFLHGRWREG